MGGGGGSHCRVSILRNGNVACRCRLVFLMSPVEFKKCLCPLSLYFQSPCRMSVCFMSPVEFKKWPCRRVDFRALGPYSGGRMC